MKRIFLFVAGYYLVIQAALAALTMCGQPENTVYILPIAGLSGWGGYRLIHLGRTARKTEELTVQDTQPLAPVSIQDQPTAGIETQPLDREP